MRTPLNIIFPRGRNLLFNFENLQWKDAWQTKGETLNKEIIRMSLTFDCPFRISVDNSSIKGVFLGEMVRKNRYGVLYVDVLYFESL